MVAQRILVVGATSAMARAAGRRFAAEGARFVLAGRNPEKLSAAVAELRHAGAEQVTSYPLDVMDFDHHPLLLEVALEQLDGLDLLLVAHGVVPDQEACEADVAQLLEAFHVNATSILSLLVPVANYFEQQRRGTIAVITSVAGGRGRRENYTYGAAKSAVSVFLQGLRARLHPAGVRVVDLRPGPVRSPMTAHKSGGLLFTDADRAGALIYAAIRRGVDIAYVPWWWRWIVAATSLVPEALFKRTDLRA
jgi:short-subunit dehydrogenase